VLYYITKFIYVFLAANIDDDMLLQFSRHDLKDLFPRKFCAEKVVEYFREIGKCKSLKCYVHSGYVQKYS
jgi:hypothetical protein